MDNEIPVLLRYNFKSWSSADPAQRLQELSEVVSIKN